MIQAWSWFLGGFALRPQAPNLEEVSRVTTIPPAILTRADEEIE